MSARDIEVRFYTRGCSGKLLANGIMQAPFGLWEQMANFTIEEFGGRPRVMWTMDSNPRFFATTPATPEDTERAERYILERFEQWRAKA